MVVIHSTKMHNLPTDTNWFTKLRSPEFHRPGKWKWLLQLHASVNSLASFGCMSSEPFFLAWGLDATEIKIVEREERYICERSEERESLEAVIPNAFEGRSIDFILADMRSVGEFDLPSSHFDLTFCRMVLYQVFLDGLEQAHGGNPSQIVEQALEQVLAAIRQMTRVTKPGGWVIAVESIAVNPGDEPTPIGPLFKLAGLSEERLEGAPEDAYCFKKAV
jgi:SAM-dependent methyltransferase